MDYTSIQLKLDNEQTCLDTLKELDKAEEESGLLFMLKGPSSEKS